MINYNLLYIISKTNVTEQANLQNDTHKDK